MIDEALIRTAVATFKIFIYYYFLFFFCCNNCSCKQQRRLNSSCVLPHWDFRSFLWHFLTVVIPVLKLIAICTSSCNDTNTMPEYMNAVSLHTHSINRSMLRLFVAAAEAQIIYCNFECAKHINAIAVINWAIDGDESNVGDTENVAQLQQHTNKRNK